jgi:hypothetical protein
MALSSEIKNKSLAALLQHYDNDTWQLTDGDKTILTRINELAAEKDIPLSSQNSDMLDTLLRTVKHSPLVENLTAEQAPDVIFGFLLTALEDQSLTNQSRHRSQGRFDITPLYQRAEKDQMQDHDMTLLMPKSTDQITVMAVLNAHDNSAAAIQDNLASEIFDEQVKHIIIPVGPGHWRGVYLTKHDGLFDLELFDPYGGNGASTIQSFILRLLESCGLFEDLLQIRYSGPVHPQGDAYSCGDFTCAYSHKKMKEFGATAEQYNENLVATLDNLGNVDNVLRLATREEIRKLSVAESVTPIQPIPVPVPVIVPKPVPVQEPVLISESEPVEVRASNRPPVSKESNPATTERSIGMTVGISAVIGAFAGAIAGFVILPAIAIVTLAVVIGAGIGALMGLAVNALSMMFASSKASTPENKAHTTPGDPTPTAATSLRPAAKLEQEPIISGPLFPPAPTKEAIVEAALENSGITLGRS